MTTGSYYWALDNSFTVGSLRAGYLEEEIAKFHRLLARKTRLRTLFKSIILSCC